MTGQLLFRLPHIVELPSRGPRTKPSIESDIHLVFGSHRFRHRVLFCAADCEGTVSTIVDEESRLPHCPRTSIGVEINLPLERVVSAPREGAVPDSLSLSVPDNVLKKLFKKKLDILCKLSRIPYVVSWDVLRSFV